MVRIVDRPDRIILLFDTYRLDYTRTRALVPDLAGTDLVDRRVGIDLRSVSFVRPFGLLHLYWLIRWLLEIRQARRVDIVLNKDNRDFCNYLKRMHLPRAFDEWPVTIYPIQDLEIRERAREDVLVELRVFPLDDEIEVEERARDILYVMTSQRDDLAARSAELHLALVELLDNIQVHSRTREAAVVVQAYRSCVELAFGDGGRGIPAALHRHLSGNPSDTECVRQALEPGVTSRPGSSGGYGLAQLLETVGENDGHLAIRSGTGDVFAGQRRIRQLECRPLPGTLVEVALAT